MADIYDQHKAAFASVSAYVIMKDGEKVATVALKFPRDGAGRLYAYVHWLGHPMVRGYASGGGYDKRSAAVSSAIAKMPAFGPDSSYEDYTIFTTTLARDDGQYWDNRLAEVGFRVLQAV